MPTHEEWEKSFDVSFPRNAMGGISYTYRDYGVMDRANLKKFISTLLAQERASVLKNVGMMRQWLNEDRNCTPMVTNEDISYWLINPKGETE